MVKNKQLIIQPKVGKNQFTKFVNHLEDEGITLIYADPKSITSKKSKIQTVYTSTSAKYVVLDKEKALKIRGKKIGRKFKVLSIKDIENIFESSSDIILESKKLSSKIEDAVILIAKAIKRGNKIVLFGNGGSAADAQHMAAEFIGRFQKERQSFPAISLTTDSSIITSIGNDYNFNKIFSRQAEYLVKNGYIIISISTTGNSGNIINGIKTSKKLGAKIISLTGKNGFKMKSISDIFLNVPSITTPRIQEAHRTIIHIICELVENKL